VAATASRGAAPPTNLLSPQLAAAGAGEANRAPRIAAPVLTPSKSRTRSAPDLQAARGEVVEEDEDDAYLARAEDEVYLSRDAPVVEDAEGFGEPHEGYDLDEKSASEFSSDSEYGDTNAEAEGFAALDFPAETDDYIDDPREMEGIGDADAAQSALLLLRSLRNQRPNPMSPPRAAAAAAAARA
jgi:hypothetical protein